MKKLIDFLTLADVAYTLESIDEQVTICNIENGFNPDKFISFDVYDNRTYKVNFYGQHDNLYFQRIGNTSYYKRVSIV